MIKKQQQTNEKLKTLKPNPNRNLKGHNKPRSVLDLPNTNIYVKLTSGYAKTGIFQKWKLNCELSINSSNSKIKKSKQENSRQNPG